MFPDSDFMHSDGIISGRKLFLDRFELQFEKQMAVVSAQLYTEHAVRIPLCCQHAWNRAKDESRAAFKR
uniref:AlNc14C8G1108 protein n=1 Tax=Albugo laibachii Nc14 TaxID=890382 RepID=F0W235_9STRA|nr:AlNc14C8G1108 [Albugo laibachii Nc14]|eukprot:CCA15114.1 AlNc14C8G1108 [Albugo laibachii Nc14]